MSWQDDENARRAARLSREIEFAEQHREFAMPGPDPRERPFAEQSGRDEPCNCGAHEDEPGALDEPGEGQPGRVLAARHYRHRADPAEKTLEAACEAADARAVAELEAGITWLTDARAELRAVPRHNPHGGRLAGSAANEALRNVQGSTRSGVRIIYGSRIVP
jgi:hypothetical protein